MTAPVSRRGAAAWQLIFGYVGVLVSAAKNLLLVPLALRYLDLDLYGGWLASGSIISMLTVTEAGLGLTLLQRLAGAHAQADRAAFAELAGTGLAIILGVAAALVGLGELIAPYVPGWIGAAPRHQAALIAAARLAAWSVALNLLFTNLSGIPVAMQHARAASFVRVFSQALEVGLVAALLPWLKDPRAFPVGLLAANGVGIIASAGITWRFWRREGLPGWSVKASRAGLLAAKTLPLLVSRAAATLANSSEAALTAALLSPSAAGILSINARPLLVAQQAMVPIATSSFSGLAHLAGAGTQERVRSVVAELLSLSAAVATVALPVLLATHAGFIRLWVGSEYYGGPLLGVVLALSVLFWARSQHLQLITVALGDARAMAVASVVEPVVKIGLLWVLLHSVGLIAGPISTAVASGLVALGVLPVLLARLMAYPWRRTVGLAASGLASAVLLLILGAGAGRWLTLANGWTALVVRASLASAAAIALCLMLNPVARKTAIQFWTKATKGRGPSPSSA
jgi:O-antigen/teichoic acid export membrane protein